MSASRPASVMSALSALSEMEKPRTRAKAAPKKTPTTMTTRNRATTTRKAASKAPATTKAKAKSVSKKSRDAKAAAPNRPTWKEIIRECISDNKDDARLGVSRFMIKRFAEETYGVEMTPLNLVQLGRAIASGTENGIFVLPKGPSGKVKLAPKTPRPSKENSKPPSKTPTTTKKVTAASKNTTAGPNKKTSSASRRNPAKKAVTGASPGVKGKGKKKPVGRR